MTLKLEGVGPQGADHVASFVAMLRECLGVSVSIDANGCVTRGEREGETPESRRTVTELFDKIDRFERHGRPVTLKILVGRNQNDVVVDLFKRREIDVGDLGAYPSSPPAGHPNRTTRCEMVAHILAEYLQGMENGNLSGPQKFRGCHKKGLEAQTSYRRGIGQDGTSKNNGKNKAGDKFRCKYSDGIHTDATLQNNNITGFR